MITIQLVHCDSILEDILRLQRENLRKHLTEGEAADQGFLTAEFSLEYLQQMHGVHPSIVALDGERVAGYALVTARSVGADHPLHADLIHQIDQLHFRHQPIRETPYVVVGQLCVGKEYRGIGLVKSLYGQFRLTLQNQYNYAITDVAQANRRSLKAHLNTGFQIIHSFPYEGQEWDVVLWNWR